MAVLSYVTQENVRKENVEENDISNDFKLVNMFSVTDKINILITSLIYNLYDIYLTSRN